MKVKDYEYIRDIEDEEDIILDDDRKEELIRKTKDKIIRGNIALNKVLEIGDNNTEYQFIYEWLNKNEISIGGINGSISGELENYRHIPKMGQSLTPDVLEETEQQRLFEELNELRNKGISKESSEYQKIRNKLIMHSMKLAKWVASNPKLQELGFEKEDLEQMAMIGLINAVDRHDVSFGNKFSSYAVPTIYYTIKNEARGNKRNIEQKLSKEWKRLERFEEQMLIEENREPTDEEIKEFLGIKDKELNLLKQYINYNLRESMDKINEDDEEFIVNQLLDAERIEDLENNQIVDGVYIDKDEHIDEEEIRKVDVAVERNVLKEKIEEVMDTLTQREAKVLKLRFGLEDGKARTLEAVGKEFGVGSERIRSIEAKALRKLRHPSRSKGFKEYLQDLGNEEWEQYARYDDEGTLKNQIVDGINIESYDFNVKKTESSEETNDEYLKEEDQKLIDIVEDDERLEDYSIEQLEETDIETIEEIPTLEQTEDTREIEEYKNSLEQVENIEKSDSSKDYLDEITELLGELNELDKMLKQTSIEIKSEKDKKEKNKELRAKMKKIEGLMQE